MTVSLKTKCCKERMTVHSSLLPLFRLRVWKGLKIFLTDTLPTYSMDEFKGQLGVGFGNCFKQRALQRCKGGRFEQSTGGVEGREKGPRWPGSCGILQMVQEFSVGTIKVECVWGFLSPSETFRWNELYLLNFQPGFPVFVEKWWTELR